MLNFIKYSLFLTFTCLLFSCKDNPTQETFDPNIVEIRLLNESTHKPLSKQKVNIYYVLEKSSMESNTERFTFIPHYNNQKGEIRFVVDSPSEIKITHNDIINDSLIEIVYRANLDAGNFIINIYFLQYNFGFSELKLYRNNILTDSVSVFHPRGGTIIMEGPMPTTFGNLLLELTTDDNGIVQIDMRNFQDIGCKTRLYSVDDKYIGTFEVVNGFVAYTRNDNDITYHQIIKVPTLNNNFFTWYIPN